MENQNNTAKRFRYKIISYITLIIYLLQPITILLANPQTTVAPNGVEIVEINAPNQNGLSHNQYNQFNVKENGLIFNNSGAIANTTLAGYILGNPNIGTNPARVILNEVMGTQPSYLNGYMEIAGKKAELIIANPNGIVGNGFGFINVSKATLTTGTPTFGNQGTLDGFNVNTGTILIQGQGLNAKEIDRVDLIAKAVEVNAGIWANQLNVVTGDNVVDTDLNIQSTKQNENSGVALDVGILGGMYADKIKLIGTQNGVGVNSKGTIVATDSLKLNQQGKIFLEGTTLANQELDVLTQAELENQGQLYTNGNLSIQSETITNKNLIAAKQEAKLNSNTITSTGILGAGINEDKTLAKTGSLEIKAAAIALKNAKTYAGKDITIQAKQSIENDNSTILANDTTTLIAKENINNTQNSQLVSGKTMHLQAGNTIENNQSSLFSAGDITLQTDNDLINKSGTIEAQKKLTTKAKQLLNDEKSKIISIEGELGANAQTIQNQGLIGSNQTVNLSAADIANQAGKIISQTEINLQAQNTLNNNNGDIQTQTISTIQAKDLQNANGHIEAGQGINLHTNSMQGNGIIQAEQFINVDVNGDYTNSQDSSLKSNGTLNVKATGNIVNQGMMNAVNQIGINGNGLNNTGTITANEKIEIKTLDTLNNNGRIDSNQISLDSNIVHNKGTIIGENLTVNTNDLTNTGSQAILATTQDANLYVKHTLDNQDHATIYSLGNIKIAANETGDMANQILNQSATIEAGENIDLSAKEITNKRTEFEMGEKITVECDEIKKIKPFTGEVTIEKIPKEKEEIVSTKSNNIYAEISGYSKVYRKYTETEKKTIIEKDSGIATIQAGQDLKIQADSLTNYVSRILANQNLAITSNEVNNIAIDHKITTIKDGDLMEYTHTTYSSPSGGGGGGSNPHTVETTKKIGDYHEEIVELIPGYDSTISGNQSVEINTIGLNNTSTTKTENILENATVIKNTQNTIEDKNATINKDHTFVLPENGLYHISKTPTSKYLVETDARFTNYKNFISSDYLLSKINYPSDKVQKRLGDGFYEQELVKKQLSEKTGNNLLTGYTDGEEQFKQLLENAANVTEALQLKIGISLTPEQINALNKDVVWLEEKEIDGEKVLVPVVYLANTNQAILKENGAIISGGNVKVDALENVLNQGNIKANQKLDLNVKNISNQGGIIQAGNQLNITAQENILNQSAKILGKDITLNAGQDIKNERITSTISYGDTSKKVFMNQQAEISATESLKIDANRDFVNNGSKASGKDITIDAGRNVDIGTSISEKKTDTWDKSHKIHEEKINTISQINASGNLAINAQHDIDIKGSTLIAKEDISLTSGNNLNITSEVDTIYDKDKLSYGPFKRKETETTQNKNVLSSLNAGENITLNSNHDMNLQGAQIIAQDKIDVSAKGNITLENVKDEIETKEYKRISGGWAKTNTDNETVIGTNLAANGDISIKADGDNSKLQITSSQVTSQKGEINIEAAKDITIDSTTEKHEREYISHQKKSGAFSSKTTDIYDYQRLDAVVGSDLSGEKIKIKSGNDLTVQAGTIVATNEVNLQAKNDIQITSATQTSESEYIKEVRKSGIFGGGGLGITIGKQKQKDSYANQNSEQIGSTIGSLDNNVTIETGEGVKITASEVIAGKDINITGKNVTIENGDNTYSAQEKHEFKQSGLSVSLGGKTIEAVQSVIAPIKRAGQVEDDRLKALYQYKAAETIKENKETLTDLANGKTDIGLNVSLGTSKSESSYQSDTKLNQGSTIHATGDVTIKATEKDITLKGSEITGENVNLDAKENINVIAGTNKNVGKGENSSSSASIGVSIGLGGITGINAGYNKANGEVKENAETHVASTITAKDTLTTKSGQDANIIGSKLEGETINMEVGKDLDIESLQDKETYDEKNSSSGFNFSTDVSHAKDLPASYENGGITGGKNKGNTNSDYESVTDQAGIYAGKGGFDIEVGKNTDLKGAVISSDATADKNKLSTDTLTYSDIENRAEYEASNSGFNFDSKGEIPITPNQGIPVKGEAESTTKSAIAEGTIEIRSNENQNISNLSRNTQEALNKLEKIFDAKTVKEQQELADLFAKEGFKLVGDIAIKQYKNAIDKARKYPESSEEYKKLMKEAEKWDEGGIYKSLLHGVVGGVTAQFAGGSFTGGFKVTSLHEIIQKELINIKNPLLHQMASALIGGALGNALGESQNMMAAIAADATKYNWLTHQQQREFLSKIKDAKTEAEVISVIGYYAALSQYNNDNPPSEADRINELEKIEGDLLEALKKYTSNFEHGLNYCLNELIVNIYASPEIANMYREEFNKKGADAPYYPIGTFEGTITKPLTPEKTLWEKVQSGEITPQWDSSGSGYTIDSQGYKIYINGLSRGDYEYQHGAETFVDNTGRYFIHAEDGDYPVWSIPLKGDQLANDHAFIYTNENGVSFARDEDGKYWYTTKEGIFAGYSLERQELLWKCNEAEAIGDKLGYFVELVGDDLGSKLTSYKKYQYNLAIQGGMTEKLAEEFADAATMEAVGATAGGIIGTTGSLAANGTIGKRIDELFAKTIAGSSKAANIAVRQAYVNEVRGLGNLEQTLRSEGKSLEEIARTLQQARRDLGVQYKDMTSPKMLEVIYARNIEKYGDKLGPTVDWLRARGKSWEQIIESAKTPGKEFNDLAGIK